MRRVEVASFVNPKRVPQMADAEAVLAGLPRRPDVQYVGLVLNRTRLRSRGRGGLHRDRHGDRCDRHFRPTQSGRVHRGDDRRLGRDRAARPRSRHSGAGTISVSFGCPFEGEVPPARVIEIARRLAAAKPVEIAIADTIGVAVPTQVTALVEQLLPASNGVPLRCHFHNTRNTAVANAYAAVMAGVHTLDASVGGIGGCPFAPNATGNVATEDLLYMLSRSGFETGIDLGR